MVNLFESEFLDNKSVIISLKKIYGINKFKSYFVAKKLGFSLNLKVIDLSNDQIQSLIETVKFSGIIVASELKKLEFLNLKRLIIVKSYRGLRIMIGLPVRGQRTHTNAKTARKNSKYKHYNLK